MLNWRNAGPIWGHSRFRSRWPRATDMILNADLTNTPYNIIFMDNHMPKMAGTAGFFDDSKFGDANSQLENYIRSGSAQKNQIEAMIIKIKNAA